MADDRQDDRLLARWFLRWYEKANEAAPAHVCYAQLEFERSFPEAVAATAPRHSGPDWLRVQLVRAPRSRLQPRQSCRRGLVVKKVQ